MKDNRLQAYRATVHRDVDACQSLDTLDLIHRLLVYERAEERAQAGAGGGSARSPYTAGCKMVAK